MTGLLFGWNGRMFLLLLWFGIFFDVLSSFSLNEPYKSNNSPIEKATTITTSTATILIPPTNQENLEGYPSPLHSIHIRPLLTPDEAQHCCTISQQYAQETGRWETPDGIRHQSYPTCDFPVDECDKLQEYLKNIDFHTRLWSSLSELYGIDPSDMDYLDLFVAHYQAKQQEQEQQINSSGMDDTNHRKKSMDRLEFHRDGSLLSFTLLLNPPEEFTGGGTSYDALRDVPTTELLHPGGVIRPLQAGNACLHCGKVLHGADTVTSGSRTVLVGFVDVAEKCYRPGVLAKACVEWGRMDVAGFRYRRQTQMGNSGWKLNHAKWLPQQDDHPPIVRGFVPAFASVQRRADPEYQRRKKLEAEDVLLRTILLSPDERPENPWEDSITIL